jgi:hypothetical protein
MTQECKCCGRTQDTRMGFCFDCAEAESVIVDGTDMYDKPIEKQEGLSTALSKVQYILKKFGSIKNK